MAAGGRGDAPRCCEDRHNSAGQFGEDGSPRSLQAFLDSGGAQLSFQFR